MKIILSLAVLAFAAAAFSQQAPKLTPEQVNSITQQLKALETTIANQRAGNLTEILEKLRRGASSDAAALQLYTESVELVNVKRKELTDADKLARENQVKRQEDRNKETKEREDGDFGRAVRLQLQYLILSLEAAEADRADQIEKMLPKLQAYIQEAIESASKLKGRAAAYLRGTLTADDDEEDREDNENRRRSPGSPDPQGGGGGNNPFIPAFQLERFLTCTKWAQGPIDFGDMWDLTILPLYREKKKSEIGAQWDARIKTELAFREGSMSKEEFELWQQYDLPELRWKRATDICNNGDQPVNGMADMLRLIKELPGHPDAPAWLSQLRSVVSSSAPPPDTSSLSTQGAATGGQK